MAKKKTHENRVVAPVVKKMKKPTKKEINKVLEYGVESAEISDIIKRDLFNRTENNRTDLTKKFDNILNGDDLELITTMKKFLKTQYQTLVKAKKTQQEVNPNYPNTKLTVKKVTQPMVDDNGERFQDSFHERDLCKFRVVIELKKPAEKKTFEDELFKLMEKYNKVVEDLIPIIEGQNIEYDFSKVA